MFLYFYISCFLILLVLLSLAPLFLDAEFFGWVLLINLITVSLFVAEGRKEKLFEGNLFRHSFLFLIGFIIVHFQHPLEYFLTEQTSAKLNIWVDTTIVTKSLVLSSLGINSFILGYQVWKNRTLGDIKTKNAKKLHNTKYLVFFSYAFLLLFIITANPLYLSGYYGVVTPGGIAVYLQVAFEVTLFSIIIMKAWNLKVAGPQNISFKQYLRFIGPWSILLISFYFLLLLFIGDRGPVIGISLLLLAGYSFYKRIWPRPYILLGIVASGAFIMTLVGVIRSFDKELSFSDRFNQALDTNKDSSLLDNTSELAGSLRTLHYAVTYVPQQYDFTYGRFQFQQIITTIPGVGALIDTYIDSGLKYKGSASFITYLEQGENPTSGTGTTCIADYYIDFGTIGVILGMFAFGFYIRRVELAAFSSYMPTMLMWVFLMVYFARSIYISRSSTLFFVKESVWIYAVITVNYFLTRKNE